ncbi:hypothetical protein [Blastomonas sp. AAP53]|uniref:hypothetical protein n=1 Tax=Blastomonas sp. AAP53 TaxID=1248760 RepID=UPI000371D528|nr:hypothetical protein [Blastomonas sp. AAP53]
MAHGGAPVGASVLASPRGLPFDVAMAHQQLWVESLVMPAGPGATVILPPGAAGGTMQGIGSLLVDTPLTLLPEPPAAQAPLPGARTVRPGGGRWSFYGWSLLRQRNRTSALAPAAQYGGSQAGMLVQMSLADTLSRPMLYARATTALGAIDDRSLALGMSARPVPGVPIDLAVERRLGLARGQPDRFAAMIVAGGAWTARPSKLRLEGYGQAGVVGLTNPQAFFDLQLLATRPVHEAQDASMALGGGVWAGGQQNIDPRGHKPWTHRVDLGPHAALSVPVERESLSFALDWRQRVDGDAQPASGAALTLSAGF